MRNLFPYYGGRFYITKDILDIISKNMFDENGKQKFFTIAEVFGGSGKLLLNLPSNWKVNKVYNDIDKRVYNLIKDLQDKQKREELFENLSFAVQSRDLFNEIKNKPYEEQTSFDLLYLITYSFNANMGNYSYYKIYYKRNYMQVTIENLKKNFIYIIDWNVENLDFREFIKKYDSEKTIFYLDPPFLKGGKQYLFKFTYEDMKDLRDILLSIKGKYILNESEVDFNEIKELFGEPQLIKTYKNIVKEKPERLEGFWHNF